MELPKKMFRPLFTLVALVYELSFRVLPRVQYDIFHNDTLIQIEASDRSTQLYEYVPYGCTYEKAYRVGDTVTLRYLCDPELGDLLSV